MVRFGIVGIGNMGTAHSKNLLEGKIPNATLTAVCDISADRRKFAENNFEDAVNTQDILNGVIEASQKMNKYMN